MCLARSRPPITLFPHSINFNACRVVLGHMRRTILGESQVRQQRPEVNDLLGKVRHSHVLRLDVRRIYLEKVHFYLYGTTFIYISRVIYKLRL